MSLINTLGCWGDDRPGDSNFIESHYVLFKDLTTGIDQCKGFYLDVRKELLLKMIELLENVVKVMAYVDANHAGNLKAERSHTGTYMISMYVTGETMQFAHRVREAQAAGIVKVGWIQGEYNLADLFTKIILTNKARYKLVDNIFNNRSTSFGRA